MSKRLVFFLVLCISFPTLAWAHGDDLPVSVNGKTTEGTASVHPDEGIAGEFGTWTVSYTVGESGINTGGGIRVELPDEWHAGPRNSTTRLQTKDPKANNYITAATSNDSVRIKTIVESENDAILQKFEKVSLNGKRTERYVFVVRVLVESGSLEKGDVISVTYGDRTGGSAGYEAPYISTKALPIMIGVDSKGDNEFRILIESPLIIARPGAADDMWVNLPSQAVAGKSVTGTIALVDRLANPIDHAVLLRLSQKSGAAEFPHALSIAPGKGYVQFQIKPTQTGVFRLKVRTEDFELKSTSNPMIVQKKAPKEKIYWGDLHSHTHYSWDGVGYNSYDYARYITKLDFLATTDHSFYPEKKGVLRGLSAATWPEYNALINKYNDPRHFVVIHAYEASFGAPYGHRNVFFRSKPGALVYPNRQTLPELWKLLEKGQALAIPHHTGKMPVGVDLSIHNKDLERNIEIYSAHGLSESYNPSHPLAFEQSMFTWDSTSAKQNTTVQDAWKMGLKLSVIASSDEHHSRPGQPNYGLAAVRAPGLTRKKIFDGLYDRRTYGTTGTKIILDFDINGAGMGETVKVDAPPEIKISVAGTDEIDWVELLRYQAGDDDFRVIQRWRPDAWDFNIAYTDESYKPGAMYYYRVRQKHQIRGRDVMAWSSPIWTEQ